ncbi:MAG: SDR family oxidoreductase [Chloroflexi bacterium]|nr:SDR family oxidoreductase [Chloroflexota bacterium]
MVTDAQSLAGKVALITGGSRGVGLAAATLLAQHGASVAILGQRAEHLRAAEAAVREADRSARVLGIGANVADLPAMERAVAETEAAFGGLDILINNAGIGRYGPVYGQPADDWRAVIETNVFGVFHATRAALPAIRRRGGGHIISVSSGAARQGIPNMSAYCTSKAALEGFMRALAAEIGDEPIKTTTVIPGSILTDFGIRTREDRIKSGQKYLEPEDVADAILFVLTQPARSWTQEVNVWPR